MVPQKYEKAYCISCQYQCEIYPRPTIKSIRCIETHYCVWPDKNIYLKNGVHCFLINKHYNFSNSGYVFVDFSRYNIRLFTNDKWIVYLIKTGLRIVLIADRLAQPLALYWKHRCQQILSIIYTSDTRNEIERKIHLSFLGQKDGRGYRQKLSAQEVLVLDLLLAEKSVKEIAQELQMAEKRIYAIKLSLQNKMGGRGKLNIILSG
ncbi:response regulator receiver protein [Klebsiella pneumoniae]|nr:response regulator receiver protein [Klebsiella pneumoniae]